MKIRQATVSDVPVLVSLNRLAQEMHADAFPEVFRLDAPDQAVAHAFCDMIEAPSSYWLVAEENQPVGFLSADFREREESWCLASHRVCYLAGIVVATAFRRRGVARALFGALQKEADARGVSSIEVEVWAFNEEAKEVFGKLGFRRMMERLTLSMERPNTGRQATASPSTAT